MKRSFKDKKYGYALLIALLCAAWHFGGKVFIWKHLFAAPVSAEISSSQPLQFQIGLLDQSFQKDLERKKHSYRLTFRATTDIIARVVYKDVYDPSFSIGFKSAYTRQKSVYNLISPLDLSIMTGQTGEDGNWQKFDVSHEYRILSYGYSSADNPIVHREDINNLHIIPANLAVRRGLDLVDRGKIVRLKGWLVDWVELGEFADMPFNSALTAGEIAPFQAGGRMTGLCYFVYLTELSVGSLLFR